MPIVIRPTWRGSPEQEQALARVVQAFEKTRESQEETRRLEALAWEEAQRARELDIRDTVICHRADLNRATLNRKLGPRTDERTESGE